MLLLWVGTQIHLIGLKLPVGDANKLYDYTIEEVADAFNVKQKADKAFSEVELQAIDNTN